MKKWEYTFKVYGVDLESLKAAKVHLDECGEQGWEAVGCTIIPAMYRGDPMIGSGPVTRPANLIFLKREKVEGEQSATDVEILTDTESA